MRVRVLVGSIILATLILSVVSGPYTSASDGPQIIVEDITYPETHTKIGYYVAEIGSMDPSPHATLTGTYNLLEHYAWLWGSAVYTFPIETREVDVWFFGSDYNDGVADFYVDDVYIGSFNTCWPPATEGWPNPPKNWFIRIVGLPLGRHKLNVTQSGVGCISIDALGAPLPVGGYLEPSSRVGIPEATPIILILVGATSTILTLKRRHRI